MRNKRWSFSAVVDERPGKELVVSGVNKSNRVDGKRQCPQLDPKRREDGKAVATFAGLDVGEWWE
jgi:hypothetical protein